MDRQSLAKTMELNDFPWKSVSDRFMAVLMKHMSTPFPFREFSNLISEFTDKKKRSLAGSLNLKLKVPADRPFPDDRFLKLIRPRMTSPPEKSKFLLAIIENILPMYANMDELTAERHLKSEKELINKFGPWHYYWSLRLFPFENDEIIKRMNELENELPDAVRNAPDDSAANGKKEKEKENDLIQRERELRQKAEKEMEATKKELRNLQKEVDRLRAQNTKLTEDKAELGQLASKYKEAYEKEQKKVSELESEKASLSGQLRKAEETIKSLHESERKLNAKLDDVSSRLQREINRLERELQFQKDKDTEENWVQNIIRALNLKVDNLYNMLRREQGSPQQGAIRKKISDALLLINSLESFFYSEEQINSSSSGFVPEPDHMKLETSVANNGLVANVEESGEKQLLGTFYRRDHGGYIVLENNETFNIPESMVNSIGLEHEAAVSCVPQKRPDGSTSYYVRLILQGDDSSAPIRKYLGYVKLGEHFKYYCVDIHNPENRFPIFEKDVEIQRPMDGDPCAFNVAIDGEYARLSKIFKQSEMAQATEHFLKTKSMKQSKPEKPVSEPFLKGCKIVIVGGLAKWFESVIEETGAELIHDTGHHPERVHAQLRRANALFYICTANSHQATWSCIEIAKKNQVPHFRIEGSKSNLRKLLWDNQHIIRRDHQNLIHV